MSGRGMMPSELGDCSGLCQESAVSKALPEKEREGGGGIGKGRRGNEATFLLMGVSEAAE